MSETFIFKDTIYIPDFIGEEKDHAISSYLEVVCSGNFHKFVPLSKQVG